MLGVIRFAGGVLLPAVLALAADSTPGFADRQNPYFSLLEVEKAWRISRGGPGCEIGVIDYGFDFFHPALHANLMPGWFAPGFYHTDFASMDAHGTMVASLIAARRAEGQDGMWGMAPGCTIVTASMGMPVHTLQRLQSEFFAKNPKASMADLRKEMAARRPELLAFGDAWLDYVSQTLAGSIRYLADRGVKVINHSGFLNLSLTGSFPAFRTRVEEAFAYAKRKDAVIVIGSGNIDTKVTDYPGDGSFVLVVGASTLADRRWTMTARMKELEIEQGSCFGPRLGVVAPIENIVVAVPHEPAYYDWKDTPMGPQKAPFKGPYEVLPWGATSSAAPQAAALAALVRSLRPDLEASEVLRLIEQGADDIGAPGFDEETGHGRLNFLRTLELARKPQPTDAVLRKAVSPLTTRTGIPRR